MQFLHFAIAALAAMSMIGAAAGADDNTRSPRASVIITSNATVVDGVPSTVPATASRKLLKNSKASDANALSPTVHNLLRNIVFETTMKLYRFVQPSSDDTARAGVELKPIVWLAVIVGIGLSMGLIAEEECDLCLSFQWDSQDTSVNTQKVFCQNVLKMMDPDSSEPKYSEDQKDLLIMNDCTELFQCQSQDTRLACCQSHGKCGKITQPDCSAEQDDLNYCKLSCDSGSCDNYWIQTETKAECDTESTALGCGACKDKGTSDAILLWQAHMHRDGFVSLCEGGPCVWTEQKTQCMGLTSYSTLTTWEACKNACCGDKNCAVWQFSAEGYVNQCWYGANCDTKGGLTWKYGGIRKTPDCVDPRLC